jgi:hypothetical protein
MRVLELMAAGGRREILRGNIKKKEGEKGNRLTVDKNARVVMSKLSNEPQILTLDRPISHSRPLLHLFYLTLYF